MHICWELLWFLQAVLPQSHNQVWTVYMLGKCLFHGTLGEFENWFEQLDHCAVEEIDDIE